MIDVNACATRAGALLEWQALTPLMREALADSRPSHGGRTIWCNGVKGGVVRGLKCRELLDEWGAFLTARAVLVREVGMAWEASKARRGLR